MSIFGFEHGASRRYAEAIGRIFGIESADAPLPPGFLLEVDRPEWSFLKDERLWMTDLAQAAVPGARSGVGISNRAGSAGSAIIVVITHIENIGGTFVLISQPASPAVPPNYTATGGVFVRDSRITNMHAQALFRNTVAGQGRATRWVLSNAKPPLQLPMVLGPDSSVTIEPTADNTAIECSLAGYEHTITPDELAA